MFRLCQLNLDAVDTVHTVDEQDKDEDECDLRVVGFVTFRKRVLLCLPTLRPYCNFAMSGFSLMKVKSLRLMVNGIGTIRDMKTTISKTRSPKTCAGHCQYCVLWRRKQQSDGLENKSCPSWMLVKEEWKVFGGK